MAKDRARDGRRQFKDVGSLQRMGEALGWSRAENKYPERETQTTNAKLKAQGIHADRVAQPHVYDVEKEDQEPSFSALERYNTQAGDK